MCWQAPEGVAQVGCHLCDLSVAVEEMIRDKLDQLARTRERYSPQRRLLRWTVLEALAAYSPEFRRATSTLAADYKLPLGLHFSDLEDILSKLQEAEALPERLRPPQEWKNTNWAGYLLGLGRLCLWFGLVAPLSWVHPSERDRVYWCGLGTPDWPETLHYFLQEKNSSRFSFYTYEIPLPLPYPWLKQPPRRRGRPALNASGQRWEEFKAVARCIAQRLLGQSWEEIADNCGLTTRKGFELSPLEIATRCRRMAKHLKIYRPF